MYSWIYIAGEFVNGRPVTFTRWYVIDSIGNIVSERFDNQAAAIAKCRELNDKAAKK